MISIKYLTNNVYTPSPKLHKIPYKDWLENLASPYTGVPMIHGDFRFLVEEEFFYDQFVEVAEQFYKKAYFSFNISEHLLPIIKQSPYVKHIKYTLAWSNLVHYLSEQRTTLESAIIEHIKRSNYSQELNVFYKELPFLNATEFITALMELQNSEILLPNDLFFCRLGIKKTSDINHKINSITQNYCSHKGLQWMLSLPTYKVFPKEGILNEEKFRSYTVNARRNVLKRILKESEPIEIIEVEGIYRNPWYLCEISKKPIHELDAFPLKKEKSWYRSTYISKIAAANLTEEEVIKIKPTMELCHYKALKLFVNQEYLKKQSIII